MEALAAERPAGDAIAAFELASANDSTGRGDLAEPLYREALATGLPASAAPGGSSSRHAAQPRPPGRERRAAVRRAGAGLRRARDAVVACWRWRSPTAAASAKRPGSRWPRWQGICRATTARWRPTRKICHSATASCESSGEGTCTDPMRPHLDRAHRRQRASPRSPARRTATARRTGAAGPAPSQAAGASTLSACARASPSSPSSPPPSSAVAAARRRRMTRPAARRS